MKSLQVLGAISTLALAISGCSTWDSMGHREQGTTVGAGGGAVAGAVVGGPVGAVVGGVAGGVTGNELAKDEDSNRIASMNATGSPPVSDRRLSTSQGTMYDRSGNSISAYEQHARVEGYSNPPGMAPPSASGYDSYRSPRPYDSTVLSDRSFVRSVQEALNEDGYNAGPVDGIIGPRTSEAIRQFQDANGMPATGRLDPMTVAALGVAQPYEPLVTGSNVTTYRR